MVRSADKVQRVVSDSILAAFPARSITVRHVDGEIPSRVEIEHPTDVTMEGFFKEFKMSATLKLSVPEYEQMIARGAFAGLDRKIEFIGGELREMSPAGPVHDDYIEFLLAWAAGLVSKNECRIRCQSGLRVGDSVPEPDFALLAPKRYGRNRPTADDVLLLVEVADSSLTYDLGEKAQLYARHGIREYWVVDVDGRTLHRHIDPTNGSYQMISRHDRHSTVSPAFHPSLKLPLSDLFL
nr:Uma2 family endonuclease [Rhodopirellula sp. SM50]